MKTFKDFIAENNIFVDYGDLEENTIKVVGSIHDWQKKLPNDMSHIDSTEDDGMSHAYKMIHTPNGKKKHRIGTYYHKSNYGEIKESVEDNTLYIKKHDDGVDIKHKSNSISLNNDHINHLTSMSPGDSVKHGDWHIKKNRSNYVLTHSDGSKIKLHKNEVED